MSWWDTSTTSGTAGVWGGWAGPVFSPRRKVGALKVGDKVLNPIGKGVYRIGRLRSTNAIYQIPVPIVLCMDCRREHPLARCR